jgi:streptomycin 6-kinase
MTAAHARSHRCAAMELPEATRLRLVARFGEEVVGPWWAGLPALVARLAGEWELSVSAPVGRGNTSLVVRCERRDGRRAMLKLTPEVPLAEAEAAALRAWAPTRRVPELWGHEAGALLLEALPNELPLSEAKGDPPPLGEVAALIRALHGVEPVAGVPPLSERVEFVFGHWIARRGGDERLAAGRELARALVADSVPPVLLHGDLHPANVLDGGPGRGLVAIDPRPCLGDPAFDAVDWVFHGEPDPARRRARSAELAALIGCDPERLWRWCEAFAPMIVR